MTELKDEVHWHQQQYLQQWPGVGKPESRPAGNMAPRYTSSQPRHKPSSRPASGHSSGHLQQPNSARSSAAATSYDASEAGSGVSAGSQAADSLSPAHQATGTQHGRQRAHSSGNAESHPEHRRAPLAGQIAQQPSSTGTAKTLPQRLSTRWAVQMHLHPVMPF